MYAYIEKSNPQPINIALEMGFAKGLGKKTILVNEWTITNEEGVTVKNVDADLFKHRYLEMLIDWSDYVVKDVDSGIEILQHILKY